MADTHPDPAPDRERGRAGRSPRRWVRWARLAVIWAVTAVVVGSYLFFSSSRTTTLAGHDAEITPRLGGDTVLLTGPVLPDVRVPTSGPVGVEVLLGKTDVESIEELFTRYALIASNADAQVAKVTDLVVSMAASAALRGVAAGAVPAVLYLILGPARRREMWDELRTLRPRPLLAVALALAVVAALWQPWSDDEGEIDATRSWMALDEFLGDDIPVPEAAAGVEVRSDAASEGTKRLISSAVDTWARSQDFYDAATEAAAELELRTPLEGETTALLVSDRHDNVGMDPVARAVADVAGATGVLGGGDDTSTGKPWEAFSLDSLNQAFSDLDRWAVTGNHDHGPFVGDYLVDLGWEVLHGEVVQGPGGGRLLGFGDPRSSGLGTWRDDQGISFADAATQVGDVTCEASADERVQTLLVHDPNLGREALARGCVDLVIGGHHHVESGPTRVDGENGEIGWSFTNGTTGGAAYAIAVGSKPRREAQMTVVTYADSGRPVGLQLVRLRTDGEFQVDDYVSLDYPSLI